MITVLTFNDGVLFRTKQFEPDYRYTLNFVDAWSVDEIIVLDVTRRVNDGRKAFFNVVSNFARKCFVPLCAGGGIRTVADVKTYLAAGADKVAINTGALRRPELISEIASLYGSQCVVLSIDAKRSADGSYEVFSDFGANATGRSAVDWARESADRGAGEILITSIDRDGSLQGYDLDLCRSVSHAVSIPVLVSGGAGNWSHFVQGFQEGAEAVCTSNIYHFTDSSIRSAKSYLQNAGIAVRSV